MITNHITKQSDDIISFFIQVENLNISYENENNINLNIILKETLATNSN